MKYFIFKFAFIFGMSAFATGNDSHENSTVVVEAIKLKNQKGKIYVCLWKEKDNGFPKCDSKAKATAMKIVDATDAKTIFENITNGEYSISLFHDENSDGIVQTNFIGIPRSGVGVSGEFTKPPRFSKTMFLLKGELNLKIEVRYLLD